MTTSVNNPTDPFAGYPVGMIKIHRGEPVAVAVIGLILGIIGLVWPQATLFTVAILFGIYLIASGIFRITVAFVADQLSTGLRWFTGLVGLLVVAAGVICLANPFRSLIVLAFVIGVGWIAEGAVDIMGAVRGTGNPRWLGWLSGILSIVAGIIMFVLPALAISAFVAIASILLIIVSISTLFTLPRARESATA
ncbi:HdeD family acid-resistance protein [Lacisediminihabitans sp.]|uniref:HdeD family acid-resistance protein n=1 Tax=Lacisediminihabitans sp. TaxID=2787631 RepID=UPI00374C9959